MNTVREQLRFAPGSRLVMLDVINNLAEIQNPAYPGERLVVCFNLFLAEERVRTRKELLKTTEKELDKIAA